MTNADYNYNGTTRRNQNLIKPTNYIQYSGTAGASLPLYQMKANTNIDDILLNNLAKEPTS